MRPPWMLRTTLKKQERNSKKAVALEDKDISLLGIAESLYCTKDYRIWGGRRNSCLSKPVEFPFSTRLRRCTTNVPGHLRQKDILPNELNTLLYRSKPARWCSTRFPSLALMFVMSSSPVFIHYISSLRTKTSPNSRHLSGHRFSTALLYPHSTDCRLPDRTGGDGWLRG